MAVEICQMSLYIKLLEDVEEAVKYGMHILPDLTRNICCGNSLIAPDYFTTSDKKGKPFWDGTEETKVRIRAFDWNDELYGFGEIMKAGGFDAVMGNPPYVRQEGLGAFKSYFQSNYKVYSGTADLYSYFVEKGIDLINSKGIFSYIVSNKWMRAGYGLNLRKWLNEQNIVELIDFGDLQLFEGETTYPCIIRVTKGKQEEGFYALHVKTLDFESLSEYNETNRIFIKWENLKDSSWSLSKDTASELLSKIYRNAMLLEEIINRKIFIGLKTALNEAFLINEVELDIMHINSKEKEILKSFIMGRNIKRFHYLVSNKFLIFFPKGWTRENYGISKNVWDKLSNDYPVISNHLLKFKEKAEKRTDQGEFWWELRSCDYYKEFEKPKIMFTDIAIRGQFSIDYQGLYPDMTGFVIASDSLFLLGVLNSKLITFTFHHISSEIRGGFLRWKRQYVFKLPIRSINFDIPEDVAKHDHMVVLVTEMLDLHKRLAAAKADSEKSPLSERMNRLDRDIDALVYELYGLTDEEIKIVEGEN
jgi:type II restriction/modification system DNA methylase subunit YeeA